eukprot:TRINITY_DN151_c0_g1_i6.p1 TRINITY_DN151_c0_g1~~TRINITY_DN151_c0_g1_i6.p1  ORF type:complete len:361 (+),score=-9.83 TRINITY_DN151_c0_g1_i6:171-1253(+)
MLSCDELIQWHVSKRRSRDIFHAEFTAIVLVILGLRCMQYGVHQSSAHIVGPGIYDSLIIEICLGAFWFHLLLAVVMLIRLLQEDPRWNLQTGFWIIKAAVLALAIFGCILFPQELTDTLVKIVTLCIVPFTIMQTYFLLLHVLKLNSRMVAAFEQSNEICGLPAASLLLNATIFLGLGLFITVWSFIVIKNPSSCGISVGFMVVTYFLCVLIILYSVSPWRPAQYGLLTSAAMFLYATYVELTVITSNPDLNCNGMPYNIKLQIAASIIAYGFVTCLIYRLRCDENEIDYFTEEEQLIYKPIIVHVAYALTLAYLCIQLTTKDLSLWTLWSKQIGLCLSLIIYFCLLSKVLQLQRLSNQ